MGKDWKKRMIRGWNYLMYALIAFAGLGAEVLIGIVIEHSYIEKRCTNGQLPKL